MIFSKFRICSSLVFLFIIFSYPVSGAKKPLDELSQDAEEILKRASHHDAHNFQREVEDHALNILESTGYNISGSEIYLDQPFLLSTIAYQRNQIFLLSDERTLLQSYDPMLAEEQSSTRHIKDLKHALRVTQNELDLQTTRRYLSRLEMQYGLLWGPDTTPKSHKSELFPPNLEKKHGWTSIYYVDSSNMMFIVPPNDYHRVENIFNSLFMMFKLLHGKFTALSQPFPKALNRALQTRFASFKVNDKLHTAGKWGRNFVLLEWSIFDTGLEPSRAQLKYLESELTQTQENFGITSSRDNCRSPSPVLVEYPEEPLDKEALSRRTLHLETRFERLHLQMNDLRDVLSDSEIILVALMPDLEEETEPSGADTTLTQLNLQFTRFKTSFKSLSTDLESRAEIFNEGKLWIPFNLSTDIEEHFSTLEESILLLEKRYEDLLSALTQIHAHLKEMEKQAGLDPEGLARQREEFLMRIPDREMVLSDLQRTFQETKIMHQVAESKLRQKQKRAQILEVNQNSERYFCNMDRTISASLTDLCTTLEVMGQRTLQALEHTRETFSAQTFTETQALEIVGKTNALESHMQYIGAQMEETITNFHMIFQDASSTRAIHIPDLELLLSRRINSMQTVTEALRTLYENMHHISSNTSMPVIQRAKSVLQPTSDIPTLLREFREISTSDEPTLLVEQNTHQLLQQFQTLTTKFLSDIAALTLIPKDDPSSAREIIATS